MIQNLVSINYLFHKITGLVGKLGFCDINFDECKNITEKKRRYDADYRKWTNLCGDLTNCPGSNVESHSESVKKKKKFISNPEVSNTSLNTETTPAKIQCDNITTNKRNPENIKSHDCTEPLNENTFRISCRIRGRWKHKLEANALKSAIAQEFLNNNIGIETNLNPLLDVYCHLNDELFILGEYILLWD